MLFLLSVDFKDGLLQRSKITGRGQMQKISLASTQDFLLAGVRSKEIFG